MLNFRFRKNKCNFAFHISSATSSRPLKSLKRTVSIVIWTVVGLYVAVIVLLHIPFVQRELGSFAAGLISDKLGTEVRVGRVDLGFVNRLIVDDVYVYDQKGKQMLRVARLSVKIDPSSVVHQRLSFSSSQFFGLQATLYQERPDSPPNFQFVLDSLRSKDTSKPSTPIDLQVNSLIIRQGAVSYRRLYKPATPGLLNTSDLSVSKLSGHIVLNRLTGDSLNLRVKKLSLEEKSGLSLRSLSFSVEASRNAFLLKGFRAELPHSVLALGDIRATYETDEKGLKPSTLKYEGTVDKATRLVPSDFSAFSRMLADISEAVSLSSSFTGTADRLQVSRLDISTAHDLLTLQARGSLRFSPSLAWQAQVSQMALDAPRLQSLAADMGKPLPDIVARLGHVGFVGEGHGGPGELALQGHLTTQAGQLSFSAEQSAQNLSAQVETAGWQLGQLLDNDRLGSISAQLSAKGRDARHLSLSGLVKNFDYNGYTYQNISLDGLRSDADISGTLQLDDPNARLTVEGAVNTSSTSPSARLQATVRQLSPQALHLSDKWRDGTFDFDLTADIQGSNLNTASGTVQVSNFLLHQSEAADYSFDHVTLTAGYHDDHTHYLSLDSDFGTADISGHFDYATLPGSIYRLVGSKLPTLPGLPKPKGNERNDFQLSAQFSDTRWMDVFLGIPLEVSVPLHLDGQLDDTNHLVDLSCTAADFRYAGARYRDASLHVSTPDDTLKAVASVRKVMDNGKIFLWKAAMGACDNRLTASVSFRDNKRHPFKGTLNAAAQFRKDDEGRSTAYVDVGESVITLGDTTWSVRPSSMVYRKGLLSVSNFRVEHGDQFVAIDGRATESASDTLTARLNGVDVRYVLDLVNFHSVDFDGLASGRAYVAAAMSGRPRAAADLTVDRFLFEGGRMGVLSVLADYNDESQQIDLNAVANDSTDRRTLIRGYVSPKHSQIDLDIVAENTRLEFMESFCGTFLNNIEARANGRVRLFGPFSNINLQGQVVADGQLSVTSLNTTYTLRGDTVRFIPDEIIFSRDTLYDRNGNIGIVNGSLHHRHLSNLSYDLNITARNLLSYNTHTFGSNTFYGTAYATGSCAIHGKSGEVTIDIDATPNPGSIIVYNVGGVGDLSDHEFLRWVNHPTATDSLTLTGDDNLPLMPEREDNDDDRVATDIRLNFLINCNPDATIKLIMDETTGDYITLNGDGVLRATYFNKGSFDLYGNYIVDHGLYKLTIQNVIKKDFDFQRGGTIAFGGDPYNADLNLKANYTLNSVSLSDLNIGRSFTSNNIRVNCLMNITGTPFSPKVDFDIDLPTLGNDVKQMVYSVINAEEEMNQQVLYLLAVGRFYTQGNNNAATESATQYSQTSLAMQSILSGTISQQLNNVLSSVVNSSNWNFGANISTGTEGFNDAEYEGLLSGRMLNNRLIFNGQFGYRDNANATTGFIGDFDLRYLLFPNGNLSINVYNKTNDRYFTRNTLTTQGIGIVMKKDFNGLRDLFGLKRRKDKTAATGTR